MAIFDGCIVRVIEALGWFLFLPVVLTVMVSHVLILMNVEPTLTSATITPNAPTPTETTRAPVKRVSLATGGLAQIMMNALTDQVIAIHRQIAKTNRVLSAVPANQDGVVLESSVLVRS